jgi:hypothetical protein
MGAFAKEEHQFLAELGLAQRNPGAFACGAWGGSGPTVTSTSPTNNQVRPCTARSARFRRSACSVFVCVVGF